MGVAKKPPKHSGELPGGDWAVCRFKGGGGLGKKMAVFERVDTPMHTVVCLLLLSYI